MSLFQSRWLASVAAGVFWLTHCAQADLWTTGYYPGYHQSYLPPSAIDFTALSHIIHFSVIPNSDGSLNAAANGITPAYSADLLAHAHAGGTKVLVCVGGASSESGFQGAASAANRAAFINNLTNFMAGYGYDGVDLDWEPLPAYDFDLYTNLVNSLRTALNAFAGHKLLAAAVPAYPVYGDSPTGQYTMFAALQNQFDQINIMAYDLSGAYSGWVTWFNSPIYDGGFRFPSTSRVVPSSDGAVSNYIANGVAPGKLGLGTSFYGDIWTHGAGTATGGTLLPRQSWTNPPTVTAISYFNIWSNYYQPNLYHWDTNAQAAYLSITNAVATNDVFLSYDDEHSCQAKVSYARNQSLGGIMIWELSQGYFSTRPSGVRDPLLQALKEALATPRLTAIQRAGQDILLSFTTAPLASYRVLSTSNLTVGIWATLTNKVPGNGGVLQITDPAATSNRAAGFYRIRTPP